MHFEFLKSAENSAFFDSHHGGILEKFVDPYYVLQRIFAVECGRTRSIKNNFLAFSFVWHQNETTVGCQTF
jgi:hypothetical protein